MLGRFLELSLPAPRILESWQFYQSLGFTSATVGETWTHRYAVVTDGRLAIGLHDAPLERPLLSYVRPDLAGHLAPLERTGVEFRARTLGNEVFNEAEFTDPAGQAVRVVEARTFSPPAHPPLSCLGWFEEYALPAADAERTRDFWERLGFAAAAPEDVPWPHQVLTSDTLNLGLYRPRDLAAPALVFTCSDPGALHERLDALGLEPEPRLPRGLDPATHVLLTAPEGTQLLCVPAA